MKIEMGESLIQSWLKHTCACQITQLNWKASPSWENATPTKEIENIYKQIKTAFKLTDNKFVSKKMSLSQFILQGEADCIGVRFKKENPLQVDKLFAVDVAFHEGGLNYGGIAETTSRIIKKNIRTALTLYQYFGIKSAVVVFATPHVLKSHVNKLAEATSLVETEFKKLGFDFEFRFYCNESFYAEIYTNVIMSSQDVSDTTELFSRSLKMVNLMNSFKNSTVPIITTESTEVPVTSTGDIKIGALVREAFDILVNDELISNEELRKLCDSSFCKETFGIYHPVLIEKSDAPDCGFVNSFRRYYAATYIISNNEYMLCNDWYTKHKDAFEKWYSKF